MAIIVTGSSDFMWTDWNTGFLKSNELQFWCSNLHSKSQIKHNLSYWEKCCNKSVKRNHLHFSDSWCLTSQTFSLGVLNSHVTWHKIQPGIVTSDRTFPWKLLWVCHSWVKLPNYKFKFCLNECGSDTCLLSTVNNRANTRKYEFVQTAGFCHCKIIPCV